MAFSQAPKDFEVAQSPGDGISSLSFSPQADFLAASSWDNQTRIYEVQPTGNTVGKAAIQHEAPVLDVCWSTVSFSETGWYQGVFSWL